MSSLKLAELCFECTACGKCCTGTPGYTWVSEKEIVEIASHLNLSLQDFADRYLRKIGEEWSLKEMPVTYDCIFLKNNKCSIYSHRPEQCRTYPFWPKFLRSKEDWEKAAQECEGIRLGAKS